MTSESTAHPVLAAVTRGSHVESFHRGAVAIVRDGRLVYAAGDVDKLQFWRSAAKPFQALAALGALRKAGFAVSDPERALLAASHGGTDAQVAVVRGLLARAGVPESCLKCGVHTPYDSGAAAALQRAGLKPTPLHHNCSGKHAGMLAAATVRGLPIDDYLNPDHPVQIDNREMLARFADCAPEDVVTEIDGCSAPTFALSVRHAAFAFARFAASTDPDAVDLRRAVAADPTLYAGTGRTCTKLLEAAGPELYPKAGAEGFYALGLGGPGLGMAVKFDDGSHRATEPLLATLLLKFAPELSPDRRAAVAELIASPVKNAAGRAVGEIRIQLP